MSKLLQEIKSKINPMVCSEHNKKAEAKIDGDNISFDCCCDEFRTHILNSTKDIFKDYVTKEIKKIFK